MGFMQKKPLVKSSINKHRPVMNPFYVTLDNDLIIVIQIGLINNFQFMFTTKRSQKSMFKFEYNGYFQSVIL